MTFEIRHYLSDTYMGKMDISSFEQLYVEFSDYEITINFDMQIIWVKDEFVYEVKETCEKVRRDKMHIVQVLWQGLRSFFTKTPHPWPARDVQIM